VVSVVKRDPAADGKYANGYRGSRLEQQPSSAAGRKTAHRA
jgi:hypothetical protein